MDNPYNQPGPWTLETVHRLYVEFEEELYNSSMELKTRLKNVLTHQEHNIYLRQMISIDAPREPFHRNQVRMIAMSAEEFVDRYVGKRASWREISELLDSWIAICQTSNHRRLQTMTEKLKRFKRDVYYQKVLHICQKYLFVFEDLWWGYAAGDIEHNITVMLKVIQNFLFAWGESDFCLVRKFAHRNDLSVEEKSCLNWSMVSTRLNSNVMSNKCFLNVLGNAHLLATVNSDRSPEMQWVISEIMNKCTWYYFDLWRCVDIVFYLASVWLEIWGNNPRLPARRYVEEAIRLKLEQM